MIPKNQPDVNPESVSVFTPGGDIPRLRELDPAVVTLLALNIFAAGLEPKVLRDAIIDALAFQDQPAHRCAACYRWMDAPDLPVACLVDGAVRFAAVCSRCERRYGERLAAKIEPYLRAEGGRS